MGGEGTPIYRSRGRRGREGHSYIQTLGGGERGEGIHIYRP